MNIVSLHLPCHSEPFLQSLLLHVVVAANYRDALSTHSIGNPDNCPKPVFLSQEFPVTFICRFRYAPQVFRLAKAHRHVHVNPREPKGNIRCVSVEIVLRVNETERGESGVTLIKNDSGTEVPDEFPQPELMQEFLCLSPLVRGANDRRVVKLEGVTRADEKSVHLLVVRIALIL